MKHSDREGEQCQALDTIKMVAGVFICCGFKPADSTSPPVSPSWLRLRWRIRGWGGADWQTLPSSLYIQPPNPAVHFSWGKTRINSLSWVMASPWEPIRRAQPLKDSVHLSHLRPDSVPHSSRHWLLRRSREHCPFMYIRWLKVTYIVPFIDELELFCLGEQETWSVILHVLNVSTNAYRLVFSKFGYLMIT